MCVVLGIVLVSMVAALRTSGADEPAKQPTPRRVKVLFLGDQGHHVPLERCRQGYSLMAEHGIDFTYTEDLNDLNPQTLARFDGLLLYAKWTRITPAQEKALLDYVEEGH